MVLVPPQSADQHSVSWLALPPIEVPEGAVGSLFEAAEEADGFVPVMFKTLAHLPAAFVPWKDLAQTLMTGTSDLSRAERELLALVVSAENRCDLCVIGHASRLRSETGAAFETAIVEVNFRKGRLDPRGRALAEFAYSVTANPEKMQPSDLDRLRKTGFSEIAILQAVWIASYFNMNNRLMSALGIRPQQQLFAANREERA